MCLSARWEQARTFCIVLRYVTHAGSERQSLLLDLDARAGFPERVHRMEDLLALCGQVQDFVQ
ncbi:hypothetical protein GCM10027343_03540 [Noviherbaspirillum agri]